MIIQNNEELEGLKEIGKICAIIRDELKDRNIILEDTSQGTRWKRG